MNRAFKLQRAMLRVMREAAEPTVTRDEPLEWECLHMAGSSRVAWILAEKRGAEPGTVELAACAAAVHDFGRILTGKQDGHAEAGYGPVREFLKVTGLFGEDEIEQIALAVKNHSRKSETGTFIEEIVKDADVIDCYQYGSPFQRKEQEERYQRYLDEEKKRV